MAYDDEQYLRASRDLSSAIYTLADNEISREDIEEMVENVLDEAFE